MNVKHVLVASMCSLAFALALAGCGKDGLSKNAAKQPAAGAHADSAAAPLTVVKDSAADTGSSGNGAPGLGVRMGPRLTGAGDAQAPAAQTGAKLKMPALGTTKGK